MVIRKPNPIEISEETVGCYFFTFSGQIGKVLYIEYYTRLEHPVKVLLYNKALQKAEYEDYNLRGILNVYQNALKCNTKRNIKAIISKQFKFHIW